MLCVLLPVVLLPSCNLVIVQVTKSNVAVGYHAADFQVAVSLLDQLQTVKVRLILVSVFVLASEKHVGPAQLHLLYFPSDAREAFTALASALLQSSLSPLRSDLLHLGFACLAHMLLCLCFGFIAGLTALATA